MSIYDQVMQGGGDGVSSLEYGMCSQDGYLLCNHSSDAFDFGFIEIERELYTQGECLRMGTPLKLVMSKISKNTKSRSHRGQPQTKHRAQPSIYNTKRIICVRVVCV